MYTNTTYAGNGKIYLSIIENKNIYDLGSELVNRFTSSKYTGFNISTVVTEEMSNDKIPEFIRNSQTTCWECQGKSKSELFEHTIMQYDCQGDNCQPDTQLPDVVLGTNCRSIYGHQKWTKLIPHSKLFKASKWQM